MKYNWELFWVGFGDGIEKWLPTKMEIVEDAGWEVYNVITINEQVYILCRKQRMQ